MVFESGRTAAFRPIFHEAHAPLLDCRRNENLVSEEAVCYLPGLLFLSKHPKFEKFMANKTERADVITTVENATEDAVVEDEDKSGFDLVTKPWNPNDIRITTKTFTIREIYTQIEDTNEEKELDLAPDFQRSFVWNIKQQVRLIESILLGIPLPAFYFNQDKDGTHQVIDGVQRLTTIKYFMSNNLQLKEECLEYLGPLRGQTFNTLDPATRRRFAGTQIVAHVIEPQTPDEIKYDIFNRVNTGGSPLTAQEIRHCMSKTRSREFLRNLVNHSNFDQATNHFFWRKDSTGQLVRDDKRMTDREMALRFCAFYHVELAEYANASSLDAFLLEFSRWIDKNARQDELSKLEIVFQQAMLNCYQVFGKGAFRRWPLNTNPRGRLNRAIFESQALSLANYPSEVVFSHKDDIQKALRALFDNPDYNDAVSFGTGSYRKIVNRLDKPLEALGKILT